MPSKRREHTEVVADHDSLVNVACELITAAAAISIGRRGFFRIALSGGSTPRAIYSALAEDPFIDWRRWQLFWGDERPVAPDHPDSNYRMAKETLLDKLAIQPGIVMRMLGEVDPQAAAASYEGAVCELVPSEERMAADALPRFDMVLLGMGDDGHTASLFPNTTAIHETERLVVANPVPKLNQTRLTFTASLINASHRVLFLVSGQDKAAMLQEILSGPSDPQRLPCQLIHPIDGSLIWLVDRAAFAAIDADMTEKSI